MAIQARTHFSISSLINQSEESPRSLTFPQYTVDSHEFKLPPISHIMNSVPNIPPTTAKDPVQEAKTVIHNNPKLWSTIARLIKQNKKRQQIKRRMNGSYFIHENSLDHLREKNGNLAANNIAQTRSEDFAECLSSPNNHISQRPAILMTKYRLNDMHRSKQKQVNMSDRKEPEWKKHVQHFSIKRSA